MSRLVELILVILLPTALGGAIIGGIRVGRCVAERRTRARFYSNATVEPIERLAARVRRLRAELDAMELCAGLPAKQLRLRALRAAYMDTLVAACERLEACPPPRGDRIPQADIDRAEAELHDRGLDVR